MTDFSEHLAKYLESLEDLRRRGASEDSIRDAFLGFLRTAFPRLQLAVPILLEKHIPALRVRGGFADALYGDLIFECKRRLDDQSRPEGLAELARYIGNQQHPDKFLGILTDGELLEVHALRGDRPEKVDELRLGADGAEQAGLWLDCYLFHEKHLSPTANDVALRFGERSPTFRQSLWRLEQLWRTVGAGPAAQTKIAEWQSLLSIVYGSPVGDEALFLRHTYLALFSRVLAFVALERRAPNSEELSGLVSGETFERMGLENFAENDFFAWVEDDGLAPEARGLLHALATRLAAPYDLGAIREDLLKELYQELVDPQTRHDLGEFYTPDWLAELTLRNAGFPPRGANGEAVSLLDPSCGSGTFLFTAIRMLREAGMKGKALVDYCSDHLAGIDVHPLAVLIAKANVLLALGDEWHGRTSALRLPVYMADTLSSEQPALEENVIRVPVDVDALAARAGKPKTRNLAAAFELPLELADRPEELRQSVAALLQCANPMDDDHDALEGLSRRLESLGVANGKSHLWRANLALMRWLLKPPATDGVWRFVLRNAYQPALLARQKFAFVAGNPPWLSYRYIQRAEYQERVRELVFRYQLLPGRQANLFTHMELATLFFVFCADRYLADGGTISFVMPRSILTGAKQHTAFREQQVAACRLLIDCKQVAPLFNVPACVVISRQGEQPGACKVPLLHLEGQLPSRNAPLGTAERHLNTTETHYSPLTAESASPYLEQIVQGASIAPRCLWFVRPPQAARVVDQTEPLVETDTSTERQAKAPWKGLRVRGAVEAEFLFATLLADNLLPFGRRAFSALLCPLAVDRRGEVELLDVQEASRRGKSSLAEWLRKADKVWKAHRKSASELLPWLNWQNKLIRQRPRGGVKLVYGKSGTHICACVLDVRNISAWQVHRLPVRGFIADYTTYWFETDNPDEAHYLCAVLNAPCVDEAIKPYQTQGAFGAQQGGGERDIHRRPFEVLPIPRYKPKDKWCRRLAELSQACHAKVEAAAGRADEQFLSRRIGALRTEIREQWLGEQLAEINALVSEKL